MMMPNSAPLVRAYLNSIALGLLSADRLGIATQHMPKTNFQSFLKVNFSQTTHKNRILGWLEYFLIQSTFQILIQTKEKR